MVLSTDGEWIAAVVDAVLEVVPLGTTQLAPPPPLFEGLSAEFLRGILRRQNRLIIVLDVARLLATKERLAFDRALLEAVPLGAEEPAAPAPAEVVLPPQEAHAAGTGSPSDDLVIIRGSHDPATHPLDLPGTSSHPEETAGRRPGLPATPEWGAPPTPRVPNPDTDPADGGQSDG
jgi:hypothetical protein